MLLPGLVMFWADVIWFVVAGGSWPRPHQNREMMRCRVGAGSESWAMVWRSRLVAVAVCGGCAAATAAVALWPSAVPPAEVSGPAAVLAAGRTGSAALLPVRSPAGHELPSAARPRDAKKGVAAWAFDGAGRALALSGASWYYTWGPDHHGIASPRGVGFVPMIWGAGSVTAATLQEVRHEGRYLLGFNEPDNAGQANMTVAQALRLWPRLMATGMQLGSPAVATGAATPGGWLDRFIRGAAARRYRVSFITVHWYGGDFATGPAVSQLRGYLEAIHARYHRPLWLTEFALIRFGTQTSFPSPRLQAAFVTAATAMLQHLSFLQRYAWFALPATPGDGTAGLFRPGAIATTAGRAFESAGP